MLVYHTCRLTDLPSIREHGLKAEMAKSPSRKAVWLHSKERRVWARMHLEEKLGGLEAGICVLAVDVPLAWLTKFADGLWYCLQDIPANRIKAVRKYVLSLEKM